MDDLGIERADYYPKVSEHIEDIISMIEKLIERDLPMWRRAMFFDVMSFPDYGKYQPKSR